MISIYKVDYRKEESTQKQVYARAKAVYHCFAIYNDLGLNRNHAKNPYESKKFMVPARNPKKEWFIATIEEGHRLSCWQTG